MQKRVLFWLVLSAVSINLAVHAFLLPMKASAQKGYGVQKTGLVPRYPAGYACSPLTSLYASWEDVDGSTRSEIHTGVDGGRLGEPILAPAPGIVIAVWSTDWGWGQEGALLIRHSREDLGLKAGPKYYYSEFDHLEYEEIRSIGEGTRVNRGDRLATVSRPGGKRRYLPEVHWEVWEIEDDASTTWSKNRFGGTYWRNSTGRLVDPLHMLALNKPPSEDGIVDIPPYDPAVDYRGFRGFTYILPCHKNDNLRSLRGNRTVR
jgi:murein DD-endopeptidase MepM/ murein hydrolase activator NlpD